MKRRVGAAIGIVVVGLVAFGALGRAPGTDEDSVNIATMSQGTVSYGAGAALAQTLLEKGHVNVRVQPNAGSSALIPQVNAGEMDIGIAGVLEVEEAAEAENIFADRPQTDLRAAMVLFPLEAGLWVRRDSGIRTIADLKGRRVTTGFNAQKSVDRIMESVLANGGLKRSDVIEVAEPNIIRGADDFIAGRADAFFLSVGSAKVLEADAAVGGVRLLSLDTGTQAMARMHEVFKYAYPTREVQTNRTTGIIGTTWVTTYDMVLVTHAGEPADKLKHMLDVFAANKAMMVGVHPAFRRFAVDSMYKDLPIPYHRAAIAWYDAHDVARNVDDPGGR